MRIFVAHDYTNPPLRNYRSAFKYVEVFADEVHTADHLLEQIEQMIIDADRFCSRKSSRVVVSRPFSSRHHRAQRPKITCCSSFKA